MSSTSHGISPSWISCLRAGEISKLLADTLFLKEIENGVGDSRIIQSLCIISSKIYEMKKVPKEEVFGDSNIEDIFRISKLFCIASGKANFTEPHLKKFFISLYHIIGLFLDEGLYDNALTLKDFIFIFGFRKECFCGDKTIATSLCNLFSRFWNCSFACEKNSSEEGLVVDLRFTAVKIYCYTGSNSLSMVSDRFMLISQKHLFQKKNDLTEERIFSLCSNLLESVVEVVNDTLNSVGNDNNSTEDSFATLFKPFCQILTELIRIYNLFGKEIEGFKVCSGHCGRISNEGKSGQYFCNFLEVLQDVWSVTVNSYDNRVEPINRLLNFKTVYLKVCGIQNSGDSPLKDTESEVNIDGITFKCLSFIKVTESICVSLVDVLPKPNEMVRLELSEKDCLYKLLRLSSRLSLRSKNYDSALKATAMLLRYVAQDMDEVFENKASERSKKLIAETKDALELGLQIEESMLVDLSFKERFAISSFAQSLRVVMEVFLKWECFEEGELFCSKYNKFALKRMCAPEFSFLKSNSWWALKNLCICYVKLEKFRDALSTLALAIHLKTPEDAGAVFKEWVKVKIKAQLSNKIDQLKLSTIYHMFKESIPKEEWQFSDDDLCYLLRLEINSYRSKNVNLSGSIKEACHAVLEISADPLARAEVQVHLLEISWHECSPLEVPINSKNMEEEDKSNQMNLQKPLIKSPKTASNILRKEKSSKLHAKKVDKKEENAGSDSLNMKNFLRLCERLVEDLKKEVTLREKTNPSDVPIILCIMAQAYYWKFLGLFHIKAEQGQKELNKLCNIPLKASTGAEDENASCDVVTNQQSLKSSTRCNLLKSSLNIAVSLWEDAIAKFQGLKSSKSDVFRIDLMVKHCLQTTAFIYELYNDLTHKVVMWSLLCQYAALCDDEEAFLLGASNLMRIEAVNLNEEFVNKSAEIASKIDENSPSLLSYWIGKSWNLLLSYKLLEGLQFLKKFLERCNPLANNFQRIMYAQAKHLLAVYCLYVSVPSRPVEPELVNDPIFADSAPRDSAISAVGLLVNLLESWNPSESLSNYFFAQSLLLDVSEWLGELFIDLCCPRESYGFLKEQFQLAQKLVLPNRTAWFLSLLARVDIMCQNIKDCEVKLKGMEMILDLVPKYGKDPAIDKLEAQFQGLKVEDSRSIRKPTVVQKKIVGKAGKLTVASNVTDRGSSPELPKSKNDFLTIPVCDFECSCPWCTDSTFQKAFLGMLFVKVWVSFDNSKRSSDWKCKFSEHNNDLMKTTLDRNKRLILALKKRLSVHFCINCPQEFDGNFPWDKIYVQFLLHLVECHLCLWEEEECSNMDLLSSSEANNKLALEVLKQIKPQFHVQYLHSKATLQKITIGAIKMSLSSKEVDKQSKDIYKTEDNAFTNNIPPEGFKTPEGNSPRVITREVEKKSSDDEVVNDEPLPESRVRVLPCLNLEEELEKEEEESKKKTAQYTKAAPRKKVVKNKIEKLAAGKVAKKNVSSNLDSNGNGKSLSKVADSVEISSSGAIEDEDVIFDSPGATLPVSKIYKKRMPTLNYSLYSRVKPVNSSKAPTSSSNNTGTSNHEPMDVNNDESVPIDQLLGATSLTINSTPEKKSTRICNPSSRRGHEVNETVKKKGEGDGKNGKDQKKRTTGKSKTKNDSFIEDSEAEIVSRKPRRLPRNPFIKL